MKRVTKKKKKWLPKVTKDVAIKTAKGAGMDLAAVGAGSLASAFMGKWSIALGAALLIGGNYVGKDAKGYLRLAGASALAWGAANVYKDQEIEEEAAVNGVGFVAMKEGAKKRLVNFKDSWLKALHIDKLIGAKNDADDVSVGSIDLSAMDALDDSVKEAAIQFQMRQMEAAEKEGEEFENEEPDRLNYSLREAEPELSYATYGDEEFDLSTI